MEPGRFVSFYCIVFVFLYGTSENFCCSFANFCRFYAYLLCILVMPLQAMPSSGHPVSAVVLPDVCPVLISASHMPVGEP